MRTITLARELMSDKPKAHAYLREQFDFPDFYGNNLDALWDLLSEIGRDTTIRLSGKPTGYSAVIEDLLREAELANPHINLQSDALTLVGGAQILLYESHLPHDLYRRMLKSDYSLSLWRDDTLCGWLIAQQASEYLIVESWQADSAEVQQRLMERLMLDWPHRPGFLFLEEPPNELDSLERREETITVFSRNHPPDIDF